MLYVYVICVILSVFSASGIGREIAIVLGRLGVRVVLWDVNKMGNEETRQIIQDRGGTAYAYLVDVSNTASVMSTAEKVLLEFFSTNCTEISPGTLGNMSQKYSTPKSHHVFPYGNISCPAV